MPQHTTTVVPPQTSPHHSTKNRYVVPQCMLYRNSAMPHRMALHLTDASMMHFACWPAYTWHGVLHCPPELLQPSMYPTCSTAPALYVPFLPPCRSSTPDAGLLLPSCYCPVVSPARCLFFPATACRGFTCKLSDFGLVRLLSEDEEGSLTVNPRRIKGTASHIVRAGPACWPGSSRRQEGGGAHFFRGPALWPECET